MTSFRYQLDILSYLESKHLTINWIHFIFLFKRHYLSGQDLYFKRTFCEVNILSQIKTGRIGVAICFIASKRVILICF